MASAEQMTFDFERGTPPSDQPGPKYFAYYGGPGERFWGRVSYSCKDLFLVDLWENDYLYGGHAADEETHLSRLWKETAGEVDA